jgi:predicted lipoprotein with Yx(FWY)xxD motif
MKPLILAAALSFTVISAALAAPVTTVQTGIGPVLAGENGMTLYTFRKDGEGVSNCYGQCETAWPPLAAKAGDQAEPPYSILTRKDGSLQWAKDGKPLYFWFKDAKKGDTTGDGFKNVWDAARP